ncbi:Superfamily II DNA or RNA helicase [Fibrobacter sp. UWEL]|nr:DEAD/DEAH box helicase family protein [Fibrobacter sp. UWEL]SHL49100.1 Superfamily II DNA or RNA helicase [Fibrobacter sp. UWEL]
MAMQNPDIKTTKPVVPMIYAYTTPGISYHDGYIKIGYTEQTVEERIYQQTHTAGIKPQLEWQGNAMFEDGSGIIFNDKLFHAYLRKKDVKQPMDLGNEYFSKDDRNEWFFITPNESKSMFYDFRSSRGLIDVTEDIVPYNLRKEQDKAVSMALDYRNSHDKAEFLWNAKPRFGKTLAVYDLMKRMGAMNVLIVTNRPAIANSWYEDYAKFIGRQSGYFFVSEVDGIKNKRLVIPYNEYATDKKSRVLKNKKAMGLVYFASLQDLKGSIYFGGKFNKLEEIKKTTWDLLVIDEAHEGVDTYKTDVAFDQIKRNFTLHLSGTPFKALANNKFADGAIFNYTYADEQKNKHNWDNSSEVENPYATLPTLNLFTYQMSEIVRDELSQGIEINGETEEFAFDLNEFFKVENGRFVHNSSVDKFLDVLTKQTKFPFSTEELRDELKHTFWLLDRVESAKALSKKLKEHPVFKDYEIVLAAGDGRIDDAEENKKSFDKVKKAIAEHEKTITLSVGQLTTGITIPEWTAVLMLSNVKSPSLYMQAAFRAQNPCLFHTGTEYKRKENAYVFDFDPARTLIIFEEFANDLSPNTSSGRGDIETRKQNVRELLNFFPVIGEDENGELIELDAEKVLTIPRKIKSVEVVRRGFMSNFLFQNISNIFSAPKEIVDLINQFEPVDEPKSKTPVTLSSEVKKDLSLDENGDVNLSDDYVIGVAADIFGPKLYDVQKQVDDTIDEVKASEKPDSLNDKLKELVKNTVVQNVVQKAHDNYGNGMTKSVTRQVESSLNSKVDAIVDKTIGQFKIESNVIEQERVVAMQQRDVTGKTTAEIETEFKKKQDEALAKFRNEMDSAINDFAKDSEREAVKTVETKIKERERDSIQDGVRDHLRGFSRTIPSFLMAYGDDSVTLATFDQKIPNNVFVEVTSITLEQFRFLRDGGKYKDSETGEEKEFKGQLFDSIVFDDSVKEFLALKKKLADYFDEKSVEDIFDYIPPQKTNQIFTPKDVVKRMVDMLEEENPGCFDDKDKTFIDLYMKSGLYITEIVKRLYQSQKMKVQFPDDKERLKHIFEKQVYGLAPTEIIYKIATSFILGFADNTDDLKHNFKQLDALPFAKEGTLQQKLDELFGT